MKKYYLTPDIRIQAIDTGDFMQAISIYNDKTEPNGDIVIEQGSDVLGNGSSVWDIEEEN